MWPVKGNPSVPLPHPYAPLAPMAPVPRPPARPSVDKGVQDPGERPRAPPSAAGQRRPSAQRPRARASAVKRGRSVADGQYYLRQLAVTNGTAKHVLARPVPLKYRHRQIKECKNVNAPVSLRWFRLINDTNDCEL